ncbi:MAG: hypothetical protein FWD68_10810 [Alphaproteobacteria bacterium]|nr:hypothetical protein [Alphaproteobacteria bacterium]
MPVFRYYFFVGGALLTLLFGINVVVAERDRLSSDARTDRTLPIRILSEHRLPDRVVIDTSLPTIQPVEAKVAADAPLPPVIEVEQPQLVFDLSAQANIRETFAQFVSTESKQRVKKVKVKRRSVRVHHHHHHHHRRWGSSHRYRSHYGYYRSRYYMGYDY